MREKLLADIVILTVLPEEYDAVCTQFPKLRPPAVTPNLYAWQFGEVDCPKFAGSYTVAVGMMGRAGTNQSALAAVEAIREWKPRYVFFTGIAGGLPDPKKDDLKKGDVVIADVIYGYEYGKIDNDFRPRGNRTYKTDLGLLNGANAYALRPDWRGRIRAKPPVEVAPNVFSSEIASGDKVVDNPANAFFAQVLNQWPKVKAVEMEGAGVGNAIEQAQALGIPVGFMMIRGISDIPRPPAENKAQETIKGEARGTQERDSWKPYAAATAAAFTVGLIEDGLPEPPRLRRALPVSELSTNADTLPRTDTSRPGVFVSHRSADVALAEQLAEAIRRAGFQVWLDVWDIRLGDSIIERINAGLETARYVILCYSEAGVLSPWMSREWMSALARQLDGYGVRVLPVRLSGGAPPAILADIKYADLVKDWERGLAELLRAMR